MSLAPGTRLGVYEVVSLLGAGGMGEVYRARDARLGRDVALKVLPHQAATDPDRLQRFGQEARAAAALNHPHIVAVYDVGSHEGVDFVVSELVEGETLRALLDRGPLAPRKAIELGAQLARGLAAAHERHIVHRDLKPENVLVTRDGRAKILDFGLARMLASAPPDDRTVTSADVPGTAPGMVLGTMGYMAPEQVRGLAVDHRADVFSFGAVLYEMLSGRRAFKGTTPADTMSAILNADPAEIESGPRVIPPIVDRLVRRCLEKQPDERFQSARDLAFALESLSTMSPADAASGVAGPTATAGTRPSRWRGGAALAGALLLLAALLASAGAYGIGAGPPPVVADPPQYQQVTFRRGNILAARFAPDGRNVVYSAAWDGQPERLFTARLDAIGEQPLGVEGHLLDVSPTGEIAVLLDDSWARLARRGTLARVPLGGGAPRRELENVGSAGWGPDGKLAVTRRLSDGRWSIEYPAGTVLLEARSWLEHPRVSPDGSLVAALEHPPLDGDNRGHVVVVSRDGRSRVVSREYSALANVEWHPASGELWFSGAETGSAVRLYAVRPGEPERLVTTSPVAMSLHDFRADGGVLLDTRTAKGRMLGRRAGDTEERDLSWFDYPLLRDMSPDGRFILFDEEGLGGGNGYSVFMRPTDGGPAVRLADGYAQRFSPDMRFALGRPPGGDLRLIPVGAGDLRPLRPPEGVQGQPPPPSFWPDGRKLVINARRGEGPPRAYTLDVDGGRLEPLTPEGVVVVAVSPDAARAVAVIGGLRRVVRLADAATAEIPGLQPDDTLLRWAADGRGLLVSRALATHQRDVARLDLATGRREVLVTLGVQDGAGVPVLPAPVVSADGRGYAYRYQQILADLFVVTGLK